MYIGSGKSSLINSLTGEYIFPMSTAGNASDETDTMNIIEVVNIPYVNNNVSNTKKSKYIVEVNLKTIHEWNNDFEQFMNSFPWSRFDTTARYKSDIIYSLFKCYELLSEQ